MQNLLLRKHNLPILIETFKGTRKSHQNGRLVLSSGVITAYDANDEQQFLHLLLFPINKMWQ